MKPEVSAASEFLSRVFLAHNNISKEKVLEFRQHFSELLEERFRDHWHETCPTKGQAFRCIRVWPEEPLDPLIEKVCSRLGINATDFKLPFELTLWVDPTEVVCKFGDLKCSYHTVAKKDQTSGNLNNHSGNLDIDDLVENARDLYLKKQTVIINPVHATELHIQNTYMDGSYSSVTMAIRINGTVHYNSNGSPPVSYDDSPFGKGRQSHRRAGGYNYYGKSSGVKGNYIGNGMTNGSSHAPAATHHYQYHHYQGSNDPSPSSSYSNGYLNSYSSEENGYAFHPLSLSPSKVNGIIGMTLNIVNGSGHVTQGPPTPEQIHQQVQHPPPMPQSITHLQPAFDHPSTDTSTQPPPPTSATTSTSCSTAGTSKPISIGNSKFHSNRATAAPRNKPATSPAKETK
ncbi:unnamed protein product [Candidula unifasciata]|uniref:Anti-proliferative protein domain-containing protein n=1 Tax=Candidula unifasciata TaxID=100452 RepID=A0A8S3ZLV4_9EUPU|nr:unnamed protein product [Candidula unifasciata]